MATTKATTPRRKAPQSAQERPAAPVVQFPLSIPTPRQTHPAEAVVIVQETAKDAVKLFVMPSPSAVRGILNETFGPLGWAERRYFADSRLWCAVGVFNPYMSSRTPLHWKASIRAVMSAGRKRPALWLRQNSGASAAT